MVRVLKVEPLEGFVVRLGFTDGTSREVDLDAYMRGPIFQSLRDDQGAFRRVRVDEELGTIVWPNGADIDPDVLHGDAEPTWRSSQQRS